MKYKDFIEIFEPESYIIAYYNEQKHEFKKSRKAEKSFDIYKLRIIDIIDEN